ncbi:MAG: cytosolic protein [Planctomycetes bacterium]|nr:cytosolic protein [Planctomycetota bacterium]MBL7040762.1 cytosolic protein [Pirellulaceae bacterium]
MTEYDSPWKEALDVYFEAFVAFFFPAAHADIDWSRGYEPLDKELQKIAPQAETGRRTVDKLMKVWRRDGKEEWVLIHGEVQSQQDPEFPVRMYTYNYRLFDRYNRNVVSLAVLGDDQRGWRPERFGRSLWGCTVDFRFPVVKLLDHADRVEELERDPNPFAAIVLTHLKTLETRQDPESRRAWKVRLIKGLYERGLGREDIRQLFRLIDWMMDLPEDLNEQFWLEIEKLEEERTMPYITSVERLGRKKGLLNGIGVSLKIKFGDEACMLVDELRNIEDNELLAKVLESIPTAQSVDQLREIVSAADRRQE